MKTCPQQYNYQVCPFCKSKKLGRVAVVRLGSSYHLELSQVNYTGYICQNCDRYHVSHRVKFVTDRAEMRRDIKSLQKFLAGE